MYKQLTKVNLNQNNQGQPMTLHKALTIRIITALALCQTSCSRKDPYKKDQTVTWKFHDKLIINAKLGERREHIVSSCKRCERESYRPKSENYLGQFPIDYQPQSFAKLSATEAKNMEYTRFLLEKPFEFNLMLNGSWVEATDRSTILELDHPDQVKVVVHYPIGRFEKQMTTRESFYNKYSTRYLDMDSATQHHGMTCYKINHFDENSKIRRCFGESSTPSISGFHVSLFPHEAKVHAHSHEPKYGNMVIHWYMNEKNLDQIQYVEKNIYRLIDAWNISPIQ